MTAVTVVIPTYERSDVLPRAIDSVLEQTFADLELVVVDDGSTDDTESVVRSYEDDRVRYVGHETNRGANAARNTGIEEAAGEYVAFLDSDDEWRPRKLEYQLERVENDDEDWVGAYCGDDTHAGGVSERFQAAVASVLERGDPPVSHEGGEELVDEILADNVHPAAGSTLLVRTEVARAVDGFDERLDRFQDPDFVVRVLDEGPLAYVDEPLVVRHDTGAPDAETVQRADEAYLQKHSDAVRRAERRGVRVVDAHNLVVAMHYLEDGDVVSGGRFLRRASVSPRQVPGVVWATGTGVRRRTGGRAAVLALVAVLVLAVVLVRRS